MQIWKNVAEKWWLENLHGFPDSGSNQKPNFTVPGALFDVFNGTLSVACSSLSSWWFHFNPFEKYARQIGSSPQVGVKIMKIFLYNKFETTTCSSFSSPLWTLDFGIGSLPPSSVALSVGTACLSQEPRGKIRGFDCLGFRKNGYRPGIFKMPFLVDMSVPWRVPFISKEHVIWGPLMSIIVDSGRGRHTKSRGAVRLNVFLWDCIPCSELKSTDWYESN